MSKYDFVKSKLKYLTHFISREVMMYANKVEAMMDWPLPKNVLALRGFLGLTRYY